MIYWLLKYIYTYIFLVVSKVNDIGDKMIYT